MTKILFSLLIIASTQGVASPTNNPLLTQFHQLGITHCDEFILKNTAIHGPWKFFLNKHSEGIDGPSTEVSLTQISGKIDHSVKTDYSFIQTTKSCFLHKKGHIITRLPCEQAVDKKSWKVQFNLPKFDYKKYKNSQGVTLYAKEVKVGQHAICLLDYEFRTKSPHSVP